MHFQPRKTPVAQKHHAISRQEKSSILHSPSGCLVTPLPLPQSLYGRTLASQPKFLGCHIDYQIFLPMVLRWRASAGAPLLDFIKAQQILTCTSVYCPQKDLYSAFHVVFQKGVRLRVLQPLPTFDVKLKSAFIMYKETWPSTLKTVQLKACRIAVDEDLYLS